MTRLIKKYKNRRLYDTTTSQYITLEQLQDYVIEKIPFTVEDSTSGTDITNSILLQIIVEIESGATQFLSAEILRHIISLANHPMHTSFKGFIEQMFQTINQSNQANPYAQASEAWSEQTQQMLDQWKTLFKTSP